MKRKLLTALLASTLAASAFAEEPKTEPVKQDMGYIAIGAGPLPLPLPVFSGGYRFQSGHWGADFPLQVITIGTPATYVKGGAVAHYYPKPNPSSQMYLGVGIFSGIAFSDVNAWDYDDGERKWKGVATVSPEFVLGHQYRTNGGQLRFLQAQVSVPTITREDVIEMPLLTISYGFGF